MATILPSNIGVTFVSQKIKKLRWLPDDTEGNKYYFTGLVDNVKYPFHVWSFKHYKPEEAPNLDEFSTFTVKDVITKFRFSDKHTLILSLASGNERYVQVGEYGRRSPMGGLYVGNQLQNYKLVFEDNAASYGEDRWIHVHNNPPAQANTTPRTVIHVKHDEMILGSIHGHMKIHQIRTKPKSLLNSIKVWTMQMIEDGIQITYPRELSEVCLEGHVTEMKYVHDFTIAASTSDGSVIMLEVNSSDRHAPPRIVNTWEGLYDQGGRWGSCTSLDIMCGQIATVGTNGTLKLISAQGGEVSRSIVSADRGTYHSVCCLNKNEILTGNHEGKMDVWDARCPDGRPASSFEFGGAPAPVNSVARHPLQPRYLLAGSETGAVGAWDLRAGPAPANLLKAHAAGVTEMHFHPHNPKKLLTASKSGELFDWNLGEMVKGPDGAGGWLPMTDKDSVAVESLMPAREERALNTFDCDRDRVLVGGEDEAFYDIKNYVY